MAYQKAAKPDKDPPKDGVTLYEAQRRRQAALATREELRTLQLKGELVRRDEVEKMVYATGRQVRDGIENVPARVSGIIAAETSQEKVFAILTHELQQALEALTL